MKFKLFLSVAVMFLVTVDLRSADDGSGLFSSLWGAIWARESREQPVSGLQRVMASLAGESGDDMVGISDDEHRKQAQVAREVLARRREVNDRRHVEQIAQNRAIAAHQKEVAVEQAARRHEVALEHAARQREIALEHAAQQREAALEYAAQQREIATRQREHAAQQREAALEHAARQREIAFEQAARQREIAIEQAARRRVAGRRMPRAVERRQEQENEESLQVMLALSLSEQQRVRIEAQEDEELKRVIALSKLVGDNKYIDVDKVLDDMHEAREQEELNKVRKRMEQAAAEDKEIAENKKVAEFELLVGQKRVASPRQLLQQKTITAIGV